jgi:hypothetical protein
LATLFNLELEVERRQNMRDIGRNQLELQRRALRDKDMKHMKFNYNSLDFRFILY